MKNIPLRERTAQKIDDQVAKVLKGLGNPEPPLRLTDVRELLLLDQQYYSSTDDGALGEVASRLRVAGKQVLARPTLLVEAIKTMDLKALYLPDQKRILLDKEQPEAKWRWNEAHEITHSILPWHNSFMQGDTSLTLTPTCHDRIEAEANFGAGRLLFLQDRFKEMAQDTEPTIKAVSGLKGVLQEHAHKHPVALRGAK